MITYKGNKLVVGKHFIYEGDVIEYKGKVFGNMHQFDSNGTQIVMTEQEANNLKGYKLNEHSLLAEQDNSEELYQVITSYTDNQLNIIENGPSNKLWEDLLNSMKEEVNKLSELGLAYETSINPIDGNKSYLQELIMDFLQDTQRNISNTSLPNIYTQLNNFIYSIEKIVGDK